MEPITKKDLELTAEKIVSEIKNLLESQTLTNEVQQFDWLRSKAIRKMMDISPGTLQNLRIIGKVRYKKIMGSYYYNRVDIQNLFEDE